MSGGTSKVWLKYVSPSYMIQERRHVVLERYEIQMPELRDLAVGLAEKYLTRENRVRWRTLDDQESDWRAGFLGREEAAQNLVNSCPRTIDLIQHRRARLQSQSISSGIPGKT